MHDVGTLKISMATICYGLPTGVNFKSARGG